MPDLAVADFPKHCLFWSQPQTFRHGITAFALHLVLGYQAPQSSPAVSKALKCPRRRDTQMHACLCLGCCCRYIGVSEADYEWLTDQIVQVANRWVFSTGAFRRCRIGCATCLWCGLGAVTLVLWPCACRYMRMAAP